MFRTISWYEFIQILLFVVAIYYISVTALFYKKEIISLFIHRRTIGRLPVNIKKAILSRNESSADKSENIAFTAVHELLEDLKVLFIESSETKMVKQELLQAIRSTLHRYPQMKETDLVDDINNHITLEVKKVCNLDVLPEDLKSVWNY
jgi:hypothetical protein